VLGPQPKLTALTSGLSCLPEKSSNTVLHASHTKNADLTTPLLGVVRAPAPDFAIPGGHYDESFLAGIVFDKCAMHLPLYRQAERLASLGIETNRQTLGRLYCKTADTLRPLYLVLKAEILSRDAIFTDDTVVPMQMKDRGMGRTPPEGMTLTTNWSVRAQRIGFSWTSVSNSAIIFSRSHQGNRSSSVPCRPVTSPVRRSVWGGAKPHKR